MVRHVRLERNISLTDDSTKCTSFVTPHGPYKFLKLPFCNSSSIFKVLVYLDDIMIATDTFEENIEILKEVLEVWRVLKLEKLASYAAK